MLCKIYHAKCKICYAKDRETRKVTVFNETTLHMTDAWIRKHVLQSMVMHRDSSGIIQTNG
jgi:Fe-S cluster biosynthesis and repair protein YggX